MAQLAVNPEAGGRELGLQDPPGGEGRGAQEACSGTSWHKASLAKSGLSLLPPPPAFKIESRFYCQTCSFCVFEKQSGTGEPTDSAADYLGSGPGSLTCQVPPFPFCKMAMITSLPHEVVMRLTELIHANDLEPCLERSQFISCFYLNFLLLPQYSCQPGLNTSFLLLVLELSSSQPPVTL